MWREKSKSWASFQLFAMQSCTKLVAVTGSKFPVWARRTVGPLKIRGSKPCGEALWQQGVLDLSSAAVTLPAPAQESHLHLPNVCQLYLLACSGEAVLEGGSTNMHISQGRLSCADLLSFA